MFTEEFRRDIYYYTVHQTSRYTFLFFTNTIKRFDSGAARAKKYKCYGSKSSLFIKEKEEKKTCSNSESNLEREGGENNFFLKEGRGKALLCIRDHDDDDDGGARQHPELLLFKDATFSILFRIEIHKQTCCGPSSFVFVLLREQWVKKSRHMACLSYQTSYPLRAPLRSLKNEKKAFS